MLNSLKLRQVIAVDQTGSITGAASKLNVTQSTITKVVADVEQDLGYALFVRKARGVIATEEGREFLNRAARIIADLDLLIEDAKEQKHETESVLRFGVSPASIEGLLNRALTKVISENPSLCLNMVASPVERGVQLLKRGDIDLLLGPANEIEAESDFVSEPVGEIEPIVFCRKDHPLLDRGKLKMEDVLEFRLIAPDPDGSYSERVADLLESAGTGPIKQIHVIENFRIVSELVLNTDLLAIVTKAYTRTATFQKYYRTLNLSVFQSLPLSVAYRRKWLPSSGMRACLSALKAYPPG